MPKPSATKGYDARSSNSFVQSLRVQEVLDASLLLIPTTGFLPIGNDARIAGTVARRSRRDLVKDGFVMRYLGRRRHADGLPGDGGCVPGLQFLAGFRCMHLSRAGWTRRGRCSTGWWGCATTWGC